MIRQDTISRTLIILAIMITIYLSTFETTTIVLFPAILLITGLIMEFYLEKKREVTDHITEKSTIKSVGYYTVLALFGIFLAGYAIEKFRPPMELTGYDALLYSMLIAVAEEQFFRGFITDWLLSKIAQPHMALLASALIFTIYHFARYGTKPEALLYAFAGGFILSWVAYKSRRLSPCMLAHILNNAIAVIGGA